MAVHLTAWLHDELATQLLLGNSWLLEKTAHKEANSRLDIGRIWRGLYHDNGSCLDITNELSLERDYFLSVVQARDCAPMRSPALGPSDPRSQFSPCLFTDGATQISASLSPECFESLGCQLRIHDVVRVRKYTIRFTSYGPPDDYLRFVLQAVDRLHRHSGVRPQPHDDELTPFWNEDLLDIARQLHQTRARDDRRCLGTAPSPEQGKGSTAATMGSPDHAPQATSQAHTQGGFGTQVPYAARPGSREDAPKILGVNRLEPVLAGNTQREELRPVPPKSNKYNKLLDLLQKNTSVGGSKPRKPAPSRSPRTNVDRTTIPLVSTSTPLLTQLPVHTHQQTTQTQATRRTAGSTPPERQRSTKRTRDTEGASPEARKRIQQHTDSLVTAQKGSLTQLQTLAAECSWMQDLEFTREAFNVSTEQMNILRKDSSWHKPSPGHVFPKGNIPVSILITLHRLADEQADKEAGPESNDDMDEDPSPEFPLPSLEASAESGPQTTQDDQLPTSEASWSVSPSPEPPKPPTRSIQQLPPDSSFETRELAVKASGQETTMPSPTQKPIFIDSSSNEDEPKDPPSSPPVSKKLADVDEDLEMEEFIPQGLGEDSMDGAAEPPHCRVPSPSPSPRPVVQVKETPYVKGKDSQNHVGFDTPPAQRLRSSAPTKQNSSTSIIYGTYNDKTSSKTQVVAPHAGVDEISVHDMDEHEDAPHGRPQQRPTSRVNTLVKAREAPDMVCQERVMSEATNHSLQSQRKDLEDSPKVSPRLGQLPAAWPEKTHVSAQIHPTDIASAKEASPSIPLREHTTPGVPNGTNLSQRSSTTPSVAKRKHNDDSPSKKNSRHSKRREIKIVSFGNGSPGSVEPSSGFREYLEESLRKFREARKSSTSFESRSASVERVEVPHTDDEIHKGSALKPENAVPALALSPRRDSSHRGASPAVPNQMDATLAASHPTPFPRPNAHTSENHVVVTDGTNQSSDVFESFKAAYPEYTGDKKHFQGQCIQMLKLDREDKMVPKWQWDDFVIRNRTDYKDYVLACIDGGENPAPYHRFYKDEIRDTVYSKGIIEGRSTLSKALRQLNAPIPEAETRQTPPVLQQGKRSRISLPSTFPQGNHTSRSSAKSSSHDRPRHSLPASQKPRPRMPTEHAYRSKNLARAQTVLQSPATNHSTCQPNGSSPSSLNGTASHRASSAAGAMTVETSDPFRDFVLGFQKMTSLTGSTDAASTVSRERDVLNLHAAFRDIPHIDLGPSPDTHSLPDHHAPQPAADASLAAFCQLAAMRLNAARSLVSLIDDEYQYILAEATPKISLKAGSRLNTTNDLLFGNVRLPRRWGICERVLHPEALAEEGIIVINDFSKNEHYLNRSYVREGRMRFYAGVPLISRAGNVVGAVCIFDHEARNGLSQDDKIYLRELADVVMDYLVTYTIRDKYRRAAKGLHGLMSFAEGATCEYPDEQSHLKDSGTPDQIAATPEQRILEKANQPIASTTLGDGPREAKEELLMQAESATDSKRSVGDLQDSILPLKVKDLFSRAAVTMRQSNDMSGVMFLDASYAASGPQDIPPTKRCNILGFATEDWSSLGSDMLPIDMTPYESNFTSILEQYPQG
ncbi:hypothetical protein ACEQ8H_002564 [Pleosporales sp. CAS-2024a]